MRFIVGFLMMALVAGPSLAGSARVSYSDGRPSEEISILEREGRFYISISHLSRLLGLEKSIDWKRQEVTLRDESHELKILIGGTVWVQDGETMAAGDVTLSAGH
jgi:hypothetical protein